MQIFIRVPRIFLRASIATLVGVLACHGEQSVQKIGDGLGAKRLMMHYEGDLEHDGSLLKNSEAILFRTVHVPISI
ncbi:hypothetical protein T4B_5096 [Trichinella pseudospiralis]|uniref:Uncharacterized protein n=1 Tax=Trichinella pseudospiralis TaxID=6337 RepID=A0A0V1JHY9_TRIPS|nr:hypothetical protein T4B_5096 [Trichinella pseudospiralis]KRZ34620.1 hypothetical protein T4C_2293 [Trichinella pseudospiralis]